MDPRSAYREGAVRGASGVRLVIFLYEQLIQDLRRAALAMEQGDVESRTKELNHAISVLGHLQSTLDRERGGVVGSNLDRFYGSVRSRLMEAQARVSREILHQQISDLLSVREAWIQVDHEVAAPQPAVASYGSGGKDKDRDSFSSVPAVSTDWKY
jgi:flagellar protein FliS